MLMKFADERRAKNDRTAAPICEIPTQSAAGVGAVTRPQLPHAAARWMALKASVEHVPIDFRKMKTVLAWHVGDLNGW
jgi:hypothetical protein